MGVGEAGTPPIEFCDCVFEHEKTPATRGFFVRQLLAIPNLEAGRVFKGDKTVMDARFRAVYAFLQPLELAADRDSDVVAVLVNHALDQFEVFSV